MFLDFGIGILMAIFTSKLFILPVNLVFVVGGIFFSVLPDSDAVFNLIKYKGIEHSYNHRSLPHLPLLYIPLGMAILFLYSPAWSVLFGLCSLMHFIHDSIGIGWGVQWLYPFNTNHYSFLYQFDTWGKVPKKFIYVWKNNNIDILENKYGKKDWFRIIYMRLHPYGLVEWAIFITALFVLYNYIK